MESTAAIEVETGPEPQATIIWLHGLGADGHDFEPVVQELDLDALPPVRFVFPHAPMRPITVNGGMTMRGWYDVTSIDFSERREDEAGIRDSAQRLAALMVRENGRGIDDSRIVLAGFSQGGAIALHAGLRHPRRVAGILALSTYLPLIAAVPAEAHAANRSTPIFMAHGWGDPVIPVDLAQRSAHFLTEAGYSLDWHAYAMDHSVCLEELNAISRWLEGLL